MLKIKPSWLVVLVLGFWTANVFIALEQVLPWDSALTLALVVPVVGAWVYALWVQQQLIIAQNKLLTAKLDYIKNRMDVEVMEAARFLITNTKVG